MSIKNKKSESICNNANVQGHVKNIEDDVIEVNLNIKACTCTHKTTIRYSKETGNKTDNDTPTSTVSETYELNTDKYCVLVSNKDNTDISSDNIIGINNINNNYSSNNIKQNASGINKKAIGSDDVLILKICDLESTTRQQNNHTSSFKQPKINGCDKCTNDSINNHRKTVDKNPRIKTKSVGTQLSLTKRIGSKRVNKNDIIVVTEDFKMKALDQHVVIDSKRKILKMMKSQKCVNSKSLEDVRQDTPKPIEKKIHQPTNVDKLKAISKSVDNVSLSSDGGVPENVGSVELIFISDEFLRKANNQKVIVVSDKQLGINRDAKTHSVSKSKSTKQSIDPTKKSQSNPNKTHKRQIIYVSEDFRRNSLKNKVVIVKEPKKRLKQLKMLKNSSQESSVDDVNNKMTSHAFHSYDEEQEDLEKKELKQLPV